LGRVLDCAKRTPAVTKPAATETNICDLWCRRVHRLAAGYSEEIEHRKWSCFRFGRTFSGILLDYPAVFVGSTQSISEETSRPQAARRIWIADTDPDGQPVDRRFAEMAYRKEQEYFRYRARELNDPAVTATLIEQAVYNASRAASHTTIEDPAGYLFRTFANLVAAHLTKAPRTIGCEPGFLADIAGSTDDPEDQLYEQIYRGQILEAMDTKTRWAWERRILGYEVQIIAKEMQVSADCMSARLRRGLDAAIKRLLTHPAE
jgi:hypothetical protein